MLSDLNFDLATVIAAVVAAIAALFSAYTSKKDNAKKDMLENLTTERINDVHNIKKWAGVLLTESSVVLNTQVSKQDEDERIRNIITAANELWFIFKPVYEIDREVLFSLKKLVNTLLDYYHEDFQENRKKKKLLIKQQAEEFRKQTFLYAHADWTCVKNQILNGQRSSYTDFKEIHSTNGDTITKLSQNGTFSDPDMNIWLI